MSTISENGKYINLNDVKIYYNKKEDTIQIISHDEDLVGKPFKITLNQGSESENTLREILLDKGVIKNETFTSIPKYTPYPGFTPKEKNNTPNGLTEDNKIITSKPQQPHLHNLFAENNLQATKQQTEWFEIPLGLTTNSDIVTVDTRRTPHTLIIGATGSGKSVIQRNIVLHCLTHSQDWEFYGVDVSKIELKQYVEHKNVVIEIAETHNEGEQLVQKIHDLMLLRYTRMEQANANNFREIRNKNGNPLKAIMFMVDEVSLFLTAGIMTTTHRNLNQIARLGRAAGIHLVIASQRFDSSLISGEFKANIETRIALGSIDITSSKMLFGSSIATRTPSLITGRSLIKSPALNVKGKRHLKELPFQSFYAPMEQLSETNPKEKIATEIFKTENNIWNQIPLGYTEQSEIITWDVNLSTHALFSNAIGEEKQTIFEENIIRHCLKHANDWVLYGAGITHPAITPYNNDSNTHINISETQKDHIRIVEKVYNTVIDRFQKMRTQDVKNFKHIKNENNEPNPNIILLINDKWLTNDSYILTEAKEQLLLIAKMGQQTGVHIIIESPRTWSLAVHELKKYLTTIVDLTAAGKGFVHHTQGIKVNGKIMSDDAESVMFQITTFQKTNLNATITPVAQNRLEQLSTLDRIKHMKEIAETATNIVNKTNTTWAFDDLLYETAKVLNLSPSQMHYGINHAITEELINISEDGKMISRKEEPDKTKLVFSNLTWMGKSEKLVHDAAQADAATILQKMQERNQVFTYRNYLDAMKYLGRGSQQALDAFNSYNMKTNSKLELDFTDAIFPKKEN